MSKGYVYILTNEAMPGLVKIGRTTRTVEGRAEELFQTGVPYPFKVFDQVLSPDCHQLEAWTHDALSEHRVNQSREFFRVDKNLAGQRLRDAHQEQVEAWLAEYLPGQVTVEEYEFVDPGHLHFLADCLDAPIYDVTGAVGELTEEELEPALKRYQARAHRLRAVAE